jgi:LVIVD repeat
MKTIIIFLVLFAAFSACHLNTESTPAVGAPVFSGVGYRPIYASKTELIDVKSQPPQPLRTPGKIYVKGNYLFINEQARGIHIINNSDPKAPQPVSFVKIMGNVDIAVKGNYLYADNGSDFVVLDITDPTNIKLSKRIENAFPLQTYPPYLQVYFECVEANKGVVVGWEKVSMSQPKCYR